MKKTLDYPTWICWECGSKLGRKPVGLATWHSGVCDICEALVEVTEPRDFGHLKMGWEKLV